MKAKRFAFIGGFPCLDFLNTASLGKPLGVETLRNFDDLLDWLSEARVIGAEIVAEYCGAGIADLKRSAHSLELWFYVSRFKRCPRAFASIARFRDQRSRRSGTRSQRWRVRGT